MNRTLIAITCALGIAGTTAFAQQQDQPDRTPSATHQSSGGSIIERVKNTMKKLGHKTRETASRAKDKGMDTADRARQDSDKKSSQAAQGKSSPHTASMGASGLSSSSKTASSRPAPAPSESDRQKRMDDAYSNSKSGQSSAGSSSR
ncbi:MAG: hypothetical protein NVS2B4_22490 [Ramlibacter sp.]